MKRGRSDNKTLRVRKKRPTCDTVCLQMPNSVADDAKNADLHHFEA